MPRCLGASRYVASSGEDPTPSALTGYSIIEAGDLDEAVVLAQKCPLFDNGGSVEVYENIEI